MKSEARKSALTSSTATLRGGEGLLDLVVPPLARLRSSCHPSARASRAFQGLEEDLEPLQPLAVLVAVADEDLRRSSPGCGHRRRPLRDPIASRPPGSPCSGILSIVAERCQIGQTSDRVGHPEHIGGERTALDAFNVTSTAEAGWPPKATRSWPKVRSTATSTPSIGFRAPSGRLSVVFKSPRRLPRPWLTFQKKLKARITDADTAENSAALV